MAGIPRSTSSDAWAVYGETASPGGNGVVSMGDSITAGDVYATGTKFFLTEHPLQPDRRRTAVPVDTALTEPDAEPGRFRSDRSGTDPIPGTILGRALEPLASGRGTIRILLMPR